MPGPRCIQHDHPSIPLSSLTAGRTLRPPTGVVLVLALSALLAGLPPAAAQTGSTTTARRTTSSDTLRFYELEPLLVTATKVPAPPSRLAASVSVLEGPALEGIATGSALEAVQHLVPGLYLTSWGVMGYGAAGQAAGKLSLRGLGGDANTHVLILRNGRPDFMGLMGCTIADEFALEGVDRIEVIRGPGSFLYGTNATGGIINLISAGGPVSGSRTHLALGSGAFGTRSAGLSQAGRSGSWDYRFSLSDRRTDGHRPDADYRGRHLVARAGAELGTGTRLEFNASLADVRVLDPGPASAPRTDNWYDLLRWGGDATLSHQARTWEGEVRVHGNFGRHEFFDGWSSRDRLHGVMSRLTLRPSAANITTLGLDWKRYGGLAHDATTDYGDRYLTEYGPYLHTQQVLAGSLIASAGLRIEHNQRYGYAGLPQAGLVVALDGATSLRLSAARGLRSPSIRELYYWLPANPELGPDLYWSREIGLTRDLGDRLHLDAVLFRLDGSELIAFEGPPPRWVNTGAARRDGAELALQWRAADRFTLDLSWSRLWSRQPVFNSPGTKLTALAGWRLPGVEFSGRLLGVRGLTGAEWGPSPVPVLHPLDDYLLADLSARVHPAADLEVTLQLCNVLDTAYQAMWGYPMPGRYLMVEVGYALGGWEH
jgi:vitamin B12 transporter